MLKLAGRTPPGPVEGHEPGQLGEAHIEADAKPSLPNSCRKVQTLSPGVKVSLSRKCWPPLTAMSKRWILRQRAPGRRCGQRRRRCCTACRRRLGYRPADEPYAVLPRRAREHTAGRAAVRLLVGDEAAVAVFAAEHLRQADDVPRGRRPRRALSSPRHGPGPGLV